MGVRISAYGECHAELVCRTIAVFALSAVQTPAPADPQALPRMVAERKGTQRPPRRSASVMGSYLFADDAVQIQGRGERHPRRPGRAGVATTASTAGGESAPLGTIYRQVSSDGTIGWQAGPHVRFNQAQKDTVGQGAHQRAEAPAEQHVARVAGRGHPAAADLAGLQSISRRTRAGRRYCRHGD